MSTNFEFDDLSPDGSGEGGILETRKSLAVGRWMKERARVHGALGIPLAAAEEQVVGPSAFQEEEIWNSRPWDTMCHHDETVESRGEETRRCRC